MNIFKRILIGVAIALAILIGAPLIAALFIDSQFVIEREIVIERPRQEVFDYLKHLKNQEQYTVWSALDPAAKRTYRGADGTVGFVAAWASDHQDVGRGEQEITKIVDGERLEVEIRMQEPFESTDPAITTTQDAGAGQTKVKTIYQGKMNYPTNLLCAVVCDRVGQNMQTNLANLKRVLEQP